ncbi:LacI family DNA-binding transcriptional regulator [Tessaracoccus sp. Z1128]
MAVTLRDVADLAKVSLKTVSNVVNGAVNVRESTRSRVQAAIDELGYRPNLAARNLKYGRGGFLALAVPELAIPYFTELAAKFDAAAAELGFMMLLDITRADPGVERVVLSGVQSRMIDGVVFSPMSLDRGEIEANMKAEVPMVFLGERAIPAGVDHVAVDSVAAARSMTQHLIDIGRERIGTIGRSQGVTTGSVRQSGFASAMDAAGMTVHPDYLKGTMAYTREAGRTAMHELLALTIPPDAVFCFNDVLAVGALRACAEAGARVPEDVAVAGFDDIVEGRYTTPSLTTVTPDMDILVREVLRILIRRIEGYTGPGERIHIPWRLTVRESTRGRRPR